MRIPCAAVAALILGVGCGGELSDSQSDDLALTTSQTLLTTQKPVSPKVSDGPNVNYELGLRLTSVAAGQITAVRFYKAAGETGTHTGRLWSAAGTQLASVVFTNETASGWQQQALAQPLALPANTEVMISVNTGATFYVATDNGLATQIVSGSLRSVYGSNGRYGKPGAYPSNTYASTNYFRDVVFQPTAAVVDAGTADTTGPSTPTGLTAVATSSSQIALSWKAATDNKAVTGYRVYRNGSTTALATVTALTFNDTGLMASTSYSYAVRAFDSAGNVSALSASTSATTSAATSTTCTQTLSVGANLPSAVAAAATGSTICLNAGDYGTVNFSNISRSGLVTLRSVSGVAASMSPQVTTSSFIRFQAMTLRGMQILHCSTNIQVVGNTWSPNTSGLVVFDNGYGCANTNKQILIDGNTFINTQPAWSEGKIGIVSVNGVTFTNNLIQGQSPGNGGDGIQTGGDCDNLVFGPGNIFRDIQQAPCDATPGVPHCDSIQFVSNCPHCSIVGNWFDDVSVVLQHHDGVVPAVFTDNLITHALQFWAYGVAANNAQIDHNTFYDLSGFFTMGRDGSGNSTSSGIDGRSNIFLNSTQPLGCTACTFSFNLATSSGNDLGTHQLIGTPTFVGGTVASITTWAGWQLTSSSLGKNAGHDGQDVGTRRFGQ